MAFVVVLLAMILEVAVAASSDLRRAHQKMPGDHVIGKGHVGMAKKLNAALKSTGSNLKACDRFSVEELVDLQRKIHQARDPALEAIYRNNFDKGRSMRAFGTHAQDLNELEAIWKEENHALKQYPGLIEASRDVKCHETIMWLVHHVPEEKQVELRKTLTMPLLPVRALRKPKNVPTDIANKLGAGIGCDEAHATQDAAVNSEYVEWPENVVYTATGHGAYPFWDNGVGCSSCNSSIDGSSTLKTWYSSTYNSEILAHQSCGDMTWTGADNAPDSSPCNSLFTPDDGAFIYTPITALEPAADGKFCCRMVDAGNSEFTGAVPRDWVKTGSYQGTYANFVGDHYSGEIKMYTWEAAGLYFWYYTKPDGTPVQQGESCQQPNGAKPTACAHMAPITLYHDWSDFQNATYAESDFAVPDICKTTTVSCTAPGGSNSPPGGVGGGSGFPVVPVVVV